MNRRIKRNQIVDRKADEFLSHVKEQVESDEVETAVAFIKHTDGSVYFVTTEAESDALIGLVEIGKSGLLNN